MGVTKLKYEPIMVVIVGSCLFLLAVLVGVNILLYASVPEHIGPSRNYLELTKRIDAHDNFIDTHNKQNNANKGKIIHEQMFAEIASLKEQIHHYRQMADAHYSKDYFEQCKIAWTELEIRVVTMEVMSGIKNPQAGVNPFTKGSN